MTPRVVAFAEKANRPVIPLVIKTSLHRFRPIQNWRQAAGRLPTTVLTSHSGLKQSSLQPLLSALLSNLKQCVSEYFENRLHHPEIQHSTATQTPGHVLARSTRLLPRQPYPRVRPVAPNRQVTRDAPYCDAFRAWSLPLSGCGVKRHDDAHPVGPALQ